VRLWRCRHVPIESNEADPARAMGTFPPLHAQTRTMRFRRSVLQWTVDRGARERFSESARADPPTKCCSGVVSCRRLLYPAWLSDGTAGACAIDVSRREEGS
jgi:hypothetical protein